MITPILLSLSLLAAPVPEHASVDGVRALLNAPDTTPAPEEWARLGADVDQVLIDAATDSSLLDGARQRALGALAIVGGEKAHAFFLTLLSDPSTRPALLSSGSEAYAAAFGAATPKEAVKLLRPLLASKEWPVRRSAVLALDRVGSRPALKAIKALRGEETEPAVKEVITAALEKKR